MKTERNTHPFLLLIVLFICLFPLQGCSQSSRADELRLISSDEITPGAARVDQYFPALQGKSIGLVCNQTSTAGNVHLVDKLISAGMDIKTIFSPEHGFRGNTEAGAEIQDGRDSKTGVKIISLYGKKKKPLPEELSNIDILLFDIQDAGVRFYTYISTLAYIMEVAAEHGIPVIVTDRPNPNGFYVDGPLLDTAFHSFVGMHPVPIVYGMTIGEYALMINGEGWLGDRKCDLTVIPLLGYTHSMIVKLRVRPSPNLPAWQSVYLYPSLCLFEGTFISVGRGTDVPFQIYGHPHFMLGSYAFKPRSIPGVSDHPPYEGQVCYGQNLNGFAENYKANENHFTLSWLINSYAYFKDSTGFFLPYFDKLAGNSTLRKDIMNGLNEMEIRESWQQDRSGFLEIRRKYLLYPDFY